MEVTDVIRSIPVQRTNRPSSLFPLCMMLTSNFPTKNHAHTIICNEVTVFVLFCHYVIVFVSVFVICGVVRVRRRIIRVLERERHIIHLEVHT